MQVLQAFKSLHRTKDFVFQGDVKAVSGARILINENFQKNKNVTDETEIQKLLKLSKDVESELKSNVIQAVEKEPGVFGKLVAYKMYILYKIYFLAEARITENTPRLDNVMFDPDAPIPEFGRKKKCCQEPQTQDK